MSISETYRIAHTAQCKLHIAADRPDRNLRFILGHAFTLDKIRLQIAQIEDSLDIESESDEGELDAPREPSPGVVNFPKSTNRPVTSTHRKKSPPPQRLASLSDSDSSPDEDDDEGEEEDLRLERFGSAAGLPPRMVDDQGSDEEDELPQPGTPSKEELRHLTKGDENPELADMYHQVAGCPCQNHQQPTVEKLWEIPRHPEKDAPRLAVVQVAA